MTRAQQPSILSFFQKQPLPRYTAAAPPPSQQQEAPSEAAAATATLPPQPPPLPVPRQHEQQAAFAPPPAPTTILAPHPSASIVPIVDAHVPALRRINTLLLPVNYQESFYHGILDPAVSGTFSRAILWQDDDDPAAPPKVIGGVVCRLERSPFDDGGRYSRELAKKAHHAVAPPPVGQGYALYIQSLGLLAPYRRYGLAAAAVQGILDAATTTTRPPLVGAGGQLRIDWVYAHVWTENEDGLAWYTARAFQKDSVLDDYYFKLKPGSAWVVKKRLAPAASSSPGGNESRVPTSGESPNNNNAAVPPPASVTAAAVNLPAFAAAPPTTTTTNNGPPKKPSTTTTNRPSLPPPSSSLSFQNKRPDMEWNDMPEDMLLTTSSSKNSSRSNLLAPPLPTATTGAGGGSASSSRSSSAQRKKKERAYPTAAFGC